MVRRAQQPGSCRRLSGRGPLPVRERDVPSRGERACERRARSGGDERSHGPGAAARAYDRTHTRADTDARANLRAGPDPGANGRASTATHARPSAADAGSSAPHVDAGPGDRGPNRHPPTGHGYRTDTNHDRTARGDTCSNTGWRPRRNALPRGRGADAPRDPTTDGESREHGRRHARRDRKPARPVRRRCYTSPQIPMRRANAEERLSLNRPALR